jgi:hypothetical protein
MKKEKTYTRIQYFIEYLTGGKFNDSRIYKIESFDKLPENNSMVLNGAYAYKLARQITEYSESTNKVENLTFQYEKNTWYLPGAFVYNKQELNFDNPKFKHLKNSDKTKFIKSCKLSYHELNENSDILLTSSNNSKK